MAAKYPVYFSHRYKLNFVQIPKCGSTTVRHNLKCNENLFWRPAAEGPQYDYKTFTVVREPFDRFRSGYYQAKKGGMGGDMMEVLSLISDGIYRNNHLLPQSWYIEHAIESGFSINHYLICDETLPVELGKLANTSFLSIAHNKYKGEKKELTDQHREMIKQVYAEDFRLFEQVKKA